MSMNQVEQSNDFAARAMEQGDSQQITNLIEQLDLDLVETQKNGRKRR